jgi:AraC family transcriptional regulator
MKKTSTIVLKNFHRSQIGRAQRFIRMNSAKNLDLKKIAKEAGASPFHFGRMFMSYTHETTFTYLRRIRLLNAVKILQEDPECPITEVALSVGYETSSAFNKVFKSSLKMSPTDFRNLGKAQQNDIIYHLSIGPEDKEMIMNLTLKPEVITRPSIHFLYVEKAGIFQEVAMPTWYELIPIVDQKLEREKITEFLGFSIMDANTKDEASMFYDAGVAMAEKPASVPKGLKYKHVEGGKYAKFVLIGATSGVWAAFEKIFRVLAENKIKLRDGACIENYLSNPEVVPEAELVTELLVPII